MHQGRCGRVEDFSTKCRSRAFGRALGLAAGLAAIALLTGCWSFRASDVQGLRPTPPTSFNDSDWPPRDLSPLPALMARTPQVVHWTRLAEGVSEKDLKTTEKRWLDSSGVRITYQGIHGQGLLRIVDRLGPDSEDRGDSDSLDSLFNFMLSGFQPNAYWLTSRTLEGLRDRQAQSELLRDPDPLTAPGIVLPEGPPQERPRLVVDPQYQDLHIRAGMDIRLPARASASEPYRGVVLHLNAMFGNEYEVRTLDEFRTRHWAVIDLKPTSQIAAPIPPSWVDLGVRAIRERQDLIARICTEVLGAPRYTAKSIDDYNLAIAKFRQHALSPQVDRLEKLIGRCRTGAFVIGGPDDYAPAARQIAEELDQAQAGSAYAAEAVLDYVQKQRDDLQRLPVVLMGFSAGGLATPTTAARIHSRLSAVVIIGGAADCFSVAQLSTFSNGGLTVRTNLKDPLDDTKLTPQRIAEVSKEYLKASRLDPYHTAPLLADLPTLFVCGSRDTWVSSACGELLWQRMGKPDRLTIDAGHELLFYFLPSKAGFIADWVEHAVGAGPLS